MPLIRCRIRFLSERDGLAGTRKGRHRTPPWFDKIFENFRLAFASAANDLFHGLLQGAARYGGGAGLQRGLFVGHLARLALRYLAYCLVRDGLRIHLFAFNSCVLRN